MIIDSDVLIWYLRGNPKAAQAILDAGKFSISIVTYMELVQGMRNKHELAKMKKVLSLLQVQVYPVTEAVSYTAACYVEQYALSNSMEMADALIAATCSVNGESLYTANIKHYKCLPDLEIQVFRPE